MSDIEIEYNPGGPLEELLLSIDRPGDFCVADRLFAPMPRLEVDGVGPLSFPVPDAQLRALIGAAARAPYGKGPATLVDRSVRDCWQIDAGKVRLSGKAWADTFARILDSAAAGLGCPGVRLDARLHKLLVYPPGGFFAPHRDTEKACGMIATLAVSLPTPGAGGELIVRHRDREIAIDMNAGEPSELAFAAFYADCTHEVRPVREGHRLSLVFNLCLRPGDGGTPREAPDYADHIDRIARRLAAWPGAGGAADKLVWLLEHDYSEAGLSFDALKNTDAALARILADAAARADCALHAAILHVEYYGYALPDEDYLDSGGRWHDEDADEMEFTELYERDEWLDGWIDRDGVRPPFGEIPLLPGELLPRGALDDATPDEQRLHEASGNEGVTLERAYRRAAFVVWPRSKTLDVIASADVGAAVAWVGAQFDRERGDADGRIGGLVARLIDLWPRGLYSSDGAARAGMLDLLARLGDGPLALRFAREVVLPDYDGSENRGLPAALRLAGPAAAGSFLPDFVASHFSPRTGDVLALLRSLGDAQGGAADAGWRGALRQGVQAVLRALPGALAARCADDAPADRTESEPIGGDAIRDLFVLAWRFGAAGDAERAAGIVADRLPAVAPDGALPKALHALYGEDGFADGPAFAALWRCAADCLLARSGAPPEAPRDWTIGASASCGCEHCEALRAFCADPVADTARFPLRQELRVHLHQVIDAARLDIRHRTERQGRPYTLVCTKNRASYERRLKEYAEDVAQMRSLARTPPGGPPAPGYAPVLTRLRAAAAAGDQAG